MRLATFNLLHGRSPHDGAVCPGRLRDAVKALDADVLAHTGDLVDGSLGARRHQVEPLGTATAREARVFITGNHEYYSGAREWTDYMCSLGWTVLRNRHVVVRRGTDALVVAGIDDRTAAMSGVPGHGADLDAALAGAPADAPVVLLAHQPRQVLGAVDRVDLQLSGHTHGGQLSAGRLHGFGFIHEAVLQLRGEAGDRQVRPAGGRPVEVAAVANGGGPIAGALLLTRDDGR